MPDLDRRSQPIVDPYPTGSGQLVFGRFRFVVLGKRPTEFAEEGFCAPSIIALSGGGNGCEGTGEREGGATIFSRGRKSGRQGGWRGKTDRRFLRRELACVCSTTVTRNVSSLGSTRRASGALRSARPGGGGGSHLPIQRYGVPRLLAERFRLMLVRNFS